MTDASAASSSAASAAASGGAADPAASSAPGGSKAAAWHCDYCRRDITNEVRIRCNECPDFDLCCPCFSVGRAVWPHQPSHDYRVVNNVKTPLWVEDWGADEELALLDAIEQFGMGNWSDVAEHVGSKTKAQCEAHYDEVYLHSATAPLPDPSKAITRAKQESGDTDMKDASSVVKKEEPAKGSAATPALAAMGKPGPTQRAHAVTKPKPKSGLGHLVGYLPNRSDFETEWQNDAELTLADMEFKDEDSQWEKELKLKVLAIYNSTLDARIERKKFILERGLLERKEKKRSKEEREVYNNMRVFARFHSAEEHEAFIQGLLNEQRLRKKIEQLQQYRLNGIRTLADGELFEAEKRKREQAAGKKGLLYDTPGSGANKGKKRTADAAAAEDAAGKKGKTESKAAANALPANPEWDVSKMPGQELLSANEKMLCVTLQLLPQHYLMIKERLIRECFTRGFLKENQAKQLIKIDVNKTSKIFDFFVSVGWLNTQDLIHTNAKSAAATASNNAAAASAASTSGANKKPAASSAAASSGLPRAPVKQ